MIKNISLLENKFKKKKENLVSLDKESPPELTLEDIEIQKILTEISIMSNKMNNYVLTINKYLKSNICQECKSELIELLKNW